MLQSTFNSVKEKLMAMLRSDDPIAVTVSLDGWSAHHYGYIGVNLHYFNGWKRKSIHLCCHPFDKKHSSQNIREFVEEQATE